MAKHNQSRHVPGIIPRIHLRVFTLQTRSVLLIALLSLAWIASFNTSAQVIEQNNQIQNPRVPQQDPEKLQRLAAELDARYRMQKQRVDEFILRTGLPRRTELEDGAVI